MSDRLAVSVAMATYQGSRYLREQLDSLAAQTVLPAELVVTDDGSTDDTEAVIRAFAAVAPFPVHWHRNPERLGYRRNFMKAADLCISPLIAFSDQDDVWAPAKLEAAVAAFADPEVTCFHHDARTVRDGVTVTDSVRKFRAALPRAAILQNAPWQFPLGFTMVFRAQLRAYSGFWFRTADFKTLDEPEAHDQWYFFLASVLGATCHDDTLLADYRQHDSNVFGIGVTRHSILKRISFFFENRIHVYERLAQAARVRARLLHGACEGLAPDHPDAAKLATGDEAWTALALVYEQRVSLYRDRLSRRIHAFSQLLRHHAYGTRGFWTFGRKALVKDFVLGICLAPLVRRFGLVIEGNDWCCAAGDGTACTASRARHLKLLQGRLKS